MTYNEWRDELKSNLLSVSESERRRVLDYYAEAYADRRDAGFTEREIIEDFGAPYDAAQRILSENSDGYYESPESYERSREERRREERELREERRREERERRDREREEREREREERRRERANYGGNQYRPQEEFYQYPSSAPAKPANTRGDYTWAFVLLCIIFAIPIFSLIMCMVGFTVSLCVAPIVALISGVASIGAGVGELFVDVTSGAITIGSGLIVFGVSLILIPICFGLVKWMWKLFRMFFGWLKKLFSGKEARN